MKVPFYSSFWEAQQGKLCHISSFHPRHCAKSASKGSWQLPGSSESSVRRSSGLNPQLTTGGIPPEKEASRENSGRLKGEEVITNAVQG